MTTLNTVNSFYNFTYADWQNCNSNNYYVSRDSTNSFTRRPLDFTISVPNHISLRTTTAFERGNPILPPGTVPLGLTRNVNKQDMGAEQALFGPLILTGTDLIADLSGHVRKSFDSAKLLYGTENPTALAALGFTTGFSLLSGGLNVKDGLAEIKKAQKISDATGKILAQLKVLKGGFQAFAGAVFIPVRALTIAALATASKVCSSLAGVLGGIGGTCFNVVSILIGISMGIKLREQYLFRKELNGILNDDSLPEDTRYARALEHLKRLATVNPREKEEVRQAVVKNEKYRSLSPEQIELKIANKEGKLLQKKEASLKRLVGDECLNMIRQSGPERAKEVIEAAQKKSLEKIILTSIGATLITIGLATTVASIFLVPGAVVIAAIIGVTTSFCWVALDAYSLFKDFNASDPGRFDKLWIFLSSIIAVVAVSIVFLLSGGVAPIIAASVVGAVWLIVNIACYYRIHQFEQKQNESLPA